MRRASRIVSSLIACTALTGLAACSSSGDSGGVWRAQARLPSEGNAILFQTPADPATADPVGVELVLGEFGPDVAGVVRYYHAGPTGPFDLARQEAQPNFECNCAYLHGGKLDTHTGLLTFTLQACVPGLSPRAPVHLRGRFSVQPDGRLSGTLQVDDPTSPAKGQLVALAFDRTGHPGDLASQDLQCATPADEHSGNVASGL